MSSSLSSSSNYPFSYDFAQQFQTMETQFNKRFQILSRVQPYYNQKSPQLLKMFNRILRHELDAQINRSASQKIFISVLKNAKLTKTLKKKLTDFSFDCIKKLNPSLNITLQKHYTSLIQLYQSYFQSIYKFQYIKRIKIIKSTHLFHKIELYISLVELILEYVSFTFRNKLQMILESLSTKSKKSTVDIMSIKNQIIKHKERELKQIRDKEEKYCQYKYKIRLPSLKGGLVTEKYREHGISISRKQKTNGIEVLGFRANRPSLVIDTTFKEQVKQLNMSLKHKTDTSTHHSPTRKQQTYKHYSFQTCDTEKKTLKLKSVILDSPKLKPTKVLNKGVNMSVRVLQSRQDFLQQFSFNLVQLSKSLGLNDLETDESKVEKKIRHKKQQWLIMNENKLLDVLLSKHAFITKEINGYAGKYEKIAQF